MNTGAIIAIIFSCAAAIALIALFCYLSNRWLCVTKYNLNFPSAPNEGVKIVHLSDLHAARFGKESRRLLKKVVEQSPDFIAITGDLIHRYRPRDISIALQTVGKLCAFAPVYIVSGNHEMRNKKWRDFKKQLCGRGAKVLECGSESAFGIDICGVNCAFLKNEKLFAAGKDAKGLKVLLAHKPEYIARYALAGYDLVLCGHAHGGQWRLPFTKQGVFSPGQGLFPKYTSGVHRCGDMFEVISRGLGNSECPLRLFNRPEIVVVKVGKGDIESNREVK